MEDLAGLASQMIYALLVGTLPVPTVLTYAVESGVWGYESRGSTVGRRPFSGVRAIGVNGNAW